MTEGRDEDEWRKRLTSRLATGPAVILNDNLRRRLEDAALSA
jgi:putative DNA primase/helicase